MLLLLPFYFYVKIVNIASLGSFISAPMSFLYAFINLGVFTCFLAQNVQNVTLMFHYLDPDSAIFQKKSSSFL